MAKTKTLVDFQFSAKLRSLRGALLSTLPHVADAKVTPDLARLRVFVTAAGVHVGATDRFTMALAGVHLVDRPQVLGCFDLYPEMARLLLKVFRPANKDDNPVVRLDVTEKALTVTDVSGLFPGTSLTIVPATPHPRWPDVPTILAGLWRNRAPASQLPMPGDYMARFTAATRAFEWELLAEPVAGARAVVVSCGESFVGALMCRQVTGADEDWWDTSRRGWLDSFGSLSSVLPELPPDPPNTGAPETKETDAPVDLTTLTIDLDGGDES